MSSEQNSPEVEMNPGPPPPSMTQAGQDGQNVPHGMGQSKSSRRRRRKRKGKGPDGGPETGQDAGQGAERDGEQIARPAQAQTIPAMQGAAAPQGNQQPQGQQPHGGQQQNGAGTKRWKKKFRDRDRQRGGGGGGAEPGNAGNIAASSNGGGGAAQSNGFRDSNSFQPGNGGGFKRKGGGGKQQRGPRSFVGPMDHSYRAVNGNFAETPPSTIQVQGNYQGRGYSAGRGGYQSDSQPIDYSQGRAIPIAEDAPTKIFFFIEDLFFLAKIQETARKLGVKVAFVKNDKESIAELTGHEEEDRPGLIVFDLNNANAKPLTLIPKLKAKLKKGTSIIGFLSHLQGDLKAKAVEAGCDTVMPRSAFSQNLPNLLRRYGIVDEEEGNFNQ